MTTTLDGIPISEDLLWVDEFSGWTPVAQQIRITADGSLEIESSARQAGRPITLQGGADHGWLDRATVAALYATTLDPGRSMILILADGRSFTVCWRHQDPPPLDEVPVRPVSQPQDTDSYQATIKLMEI